MSNYPESTGPNDPAAPWNQEGWTREQENLVKELKDIEQRIEALEDELSALKDRRTDIRIEIWDTGLDPDDALALADGKEEK